MIDTAATPASVDSDSLDNRFNSLPTFQAVQHLIATIADSSPSTPQNTPGTPQGSVIGDAVEDPFLDPFLEEELVVVLRSLKYLCVIALRDFDHQLDYFQQSCRRCYIPGVVGPSIGCHCYSGPVWVIFVQAHFTLNKRVAHPRSSV